MKSDPCNAFVNGEKTFSNSNKLTVADGHIVTFTHAGNNVNYFVNISDLEYNGNDSGSQDNNKSTATWLQLKKGDTVYYRFKLLSKTNTTNIDFNFAARTPGGTALENIFGDKSFNNVAAGDVLEHVYTASDDVTVSCITSWHAFSSNHTYTAVWDIEIYVNDNRIV